MFVAAQQFASQPRNQPHSTWQEDSVMLVEIATRVGFAYAIGMTAFAVLLHVAA